jgi:hypothetical protein
MANFFLFLFLGCGILQFFPIPGKPFQHKLKIISILILGITIYLVIKLLLSSLTLCSSLKTNFRDLNLLNFQRTTTLSWKFQEIAQLLVFAMPIEE